ncbi:MAG: right-handed parallel beta-helix repeat-containing protein [Verrucomicrobia bacterium]|nr:right-handed parallel beta-helix repeat-containing protein [Verrucomicrobiota bacterium]
MRSLVAEQTTPSLLDRYESTYVVSLDPSKGDFTTLQDAINALPPTGGKIFVKAGAYPPITSTITITVSNVHIQGEGMGITVFVGDSTMTGNTPILQVHNSAVGTPRPLLADTARGDTTLSLSPADATSFSPGDYVLLYSNKEIDTEEPAKHAGEIKVITAIDSTSGVVTVDDQIFDTYTVADSANVIRITVLQNITVSDLSITTNAPSSALTSGFTRFQFIENLQIQRVEVHDAFNTGIHLLSVRNAKVSDCYIHHIKDVAVTPPANERYGIVVGSASQNVSISGCRFSHTRHAVTTGGSSGTNLNGVPRNIVIANCTSMLTDTAHFDTHQPAENVTFIGCAAIGGVPALSEAYGFQMRGRNCSIIGCSILQAIGRGIMLFGPVSSGASIIGTMIANVAAIGGKDGMGIYFAGPETPGAPATSDHTVTGNVIKNCEGSAIANGGSNSDIVISGNVIENTNSVVPGAAIQLTDATRILITGNNVGGAGQNPAIAMVGNSDAWQINQNFLGNIGPAAVSLQGTGSVVINNSGYNPIGATPNPWPANGGDLTNQVQAGSPNPQIGTTYTVRHTPKTVIVTGGDVSQITINGVNTGLLAGVFKLGLGETIAITYNTLVPTTAVFTE